MLLYGHRPGSRGPVGVDQQVVCDPEQPWPDRPVIGAQLRQVAPCPDEGFLHDVFCARPVRAEPLDVTVQGFGMVRVQLADDGIGIAVRPASVSICNISHVY
jgi:hypothetical protein